MTGRAAQHDSSYDLSAKTVFDLIDHLDEYIPEGERALIERSVAALSEFENAMVRTNVPAPTIAPARYALAVLIDQRARQDPRLRLSTWNVLANQRLFDGRDMSTDRIRDFLKTAQKSGSEYHQLGLFLQRVIDRDADKRTGPRRKESNWSAFAAISLVVFLVALASYATWLEYRFHARITESFKQDEIAIGLDHNPTGADLARRMNLLSEAVDRVTRAAQLAPFRRVVRLPKIDSQTVAEGAYRAASERHVPRTLAIILDEQLATEGDALKLYDALRAWAVLSGDTDWTPGYLAGWIDDTKPALRELGFSAHVAALSGAASNLRTTDPEIMDQARDFATETSEVDRVWLELKRSEGSRALLGWSPAGEILGLADVLERRSGVDLATPLLGLFTAAGWNYARDFGIGIAVQNARDFAPSILGTDFEIVNDTPDRVLDRLHLETINIWKEWLADLRVRHFSTRGQAILVSGSLAQTNNPLTTLLREVWVQVGGTDRSRDHAHQLKLATEFGPMIQYVENNGMEQVGRLFSALNVALGSVDIDAQRGTQRLMSMQDRARSVNVLQNAPRVVVLIAEDVLAQASVAQDDNATSPLTAGWLRTVYPLCRATLSGRFPFGEGPDAVPSEVAALLSPNGALLRFYQAYAAPYIDHSASPWRWKPEARFAGLSPESAAFFERAVAISSALFETNGEMQQTLTLTALAERGNTVFALGGTGVSVRTTKAPATLNWPGPVPEYGVEVSFREGSESARITQSGSWGLLRMLDTLRLRFRDDGQRVLVDLRTDEGRIFLEMRLTRPLNLVSGRHYFRDFACPPRL